MDQDLALEIMLSGESVLLTGAAGSGKTHLLNNYVKHAKAEGKKVAKTATTGLAATHIGGNTIHSWSGIGVHDELPKKFEENLLKGRRDIIEKTDVLIIDEISMLHDYRLDMVDAALRKVRKEPNMSFGGIQVIFSGDFFQLPPVNRKDSKQGGFVVHSEAWQELAPKIIYLDSQHRQDDPEFLEVLSALRAGDIRRNHAESLLERIIEDEASMFEKSTELYTVNVDVDRINTKRLSEISQDEVVYSAKITGKEHYTESLKKSCLAQEELVLKKGAFVMAIRNAADRKYANGSLGTVVGFESLSNYPIVEFLNGNKVIVAPETWELRDGDKKRAGLTQIPLRLAWAITVHKSQGMTLDKARIDLRRAFVEGMGYVALSRVRRLQDLELIGINQMALKVSQDAVEIDANLRELSHKAAGEFAHLREKAKNRKKTPLAIKVKISSEVENSDLYKKLKSWRFEKAKELSVPAYIVAHNSLLEQLAIWKPENEKDLARVPGMGEKKIETHGSDILKIIKKHK